MVLACVLLLLLFHTLCRLNRRNHGASNRERNTALLVLHGLLAIVSVLRSGDIHLFGGNSNIACWGEYIAARLMVSLTTVDSHIACNTTYRAGYIRHLLAIVGIGELTAAQQ